MNEIHEGWLGSPELSPYRHEQARAWLRMWGVIGWHARVDCMLAALENWANTTSEHLIQHRRVILQVQNNHANLEVDVKKVAHKVAKG